jgi:hypothetical protein
MKITLSSQSGFSIVQGLIFAAVLAGSSLVATKMLTDQKHIQKGAETRDQIEQLHSTIFSLLQNSDNCKASVMGTGGILRTNEVDSNLNISDNLVDLPVNHPQSHPIMRTIRAVTQLDGSTNDTSYNQARVLFGSPYTPNSGPVVNPTYMNGNVLIKQMKWEYPVLNAIPTVLSPNPGPLSLGLGYLHIDYERLNDSGDVRTKKGTGAKDIRKTILVRIQREVGSPNPGPPSDFVSCYAVSDISIAATGASDDGTLDLSKDLCTSLTEDGNIDSTKSLFTWDENTSNCLPKNRTCLNSDEIFTGIDSNGKTMCRKIKDYINMQDYIDPFLPQTCLQTMTVSIVKLPSGKVRFTCD